MPQKKIILDVEGMTCAACALTVEKSLNNLDSIQEAAVNLADHSVTLSLKDTNPDFELLMNTVKNAGYKLLLPNSEDAEHRASERADALKLKLRKTLAVALIALLLMILNMGAKNWDASPYLQWGLATIALFGFGSTFFRNALVQARNLRANMDTLVALSTGVAYTFSVFNTLKPEYLASRQITPHLYFEAAAMILAFIMFGKYLESRATAKTSEALEGLKKLRSDKVLALVDEKEIWLDLKDIQKGDLVIVKEGQMIPVDGEVFDGTGFIEESMLTGEPIAVEKHKEDEVFEGTLLQNGRIIIRTVAVGSGTLLSQIIERVRTAQGSKAKVQGLVDKVAAKFVPAIIILASITFAVWYYSGYDQALSQALVSAISVLVIACPCALGLATPTALMVGIGEAAKQQIIIKDAQSLELAHRITDLVLDKTGTVTEGYPTVESIIWTEGSDTPFHRSILHSLENLSGHPLAKAVVKSLGSELQSIPLSKYEMKRGRGIRAEYVGIPYKIGNTEWMSENDIPLSEEILLKSEEEQAKGKTVLFFGGYEKLLACIALSDPLKEGVQKQIKELQQQGITAHLLSGDDSKTTSYVADLLNIKSWKGSQLPMDKGQFISKLKDEGKVVGMIGDGINDTEALAQADVSIAMGKGSDIAIDAAQMTLLNGDLTKVSRAIGLSHLTMQTLKANLFWAFIYNIIGIPIAAGVFVMSFDISISPMMAAAAMAFSSVSVVLNSLYLRKRIESLGPA